MSDKDTFTGQDMFRDPIIVQRHANGSVVIGQPGEFRGTDEAVTISMNLDTARLRRVGAGEQAGGGQGRSLRAPRGGRRIEVKSLAQQISSRCVYFTGIGNKECRAGVSYDSVCDTSESGLKRWPCFRDGAACRTCDKRHFPTDDEVADEVASIRAYSEKVNKAMGAAKLDAKSRGLGKDSGGSGSISCPCCNGGTLHYRVSGYNGHMHAACETKGCAAWME